MAHTEKDQPHYVTAEWWQPCHVGCRQVWPNRRWTVPPPHDCDLPPEPPGRYDRTGTPGGHCRWEPDWLPRGHRLYTSPYSRPPRWFLRHVWWGPERVATRDYGRRAAAEYRATGTVDAEPRTYQHRHCGHWLWE